MDPHDWNFPFEEPLHEVFPALHEAQSSWLGQIDSLEAPAPCDGCLVAADAGLWSLLPPVPPMPGMAPASSRLGAAYVEQLARER